ncbi:MAG: PIN domain-containing protein [archaeon]
MACLDTSFLIDLLSGTDRALAMQESLDDEGIRHSVAPVSGAELAVGAQLGSARDRDEAMALLDSLRWLAFDRSVASRVGRIQARQYDAGHPLGLTDCMIAATAIEHGESLVTADGDFERIDGLQVRRY